MAEGSISPKALAAAISHALYEDRLANLSGPPDIVLNTLQTMGMGGERDKPGPWEEIDDATPLFTRPAMDGSLYDGLIDEREQTANLATMYRTMDLRGVLGSYLAKPAVKTITGLLKGGKDYGIDKFINDVEDKLGAAKIEYERYEDMRKIEATKKPKPNNVSTFYRFIKDKNGKFDAVPEGMIESFGKHPSDWPKDGVYDVDFSEIPIGKAKPKEIDHTHITCD